MIFDGIGTYHINGSVIREHIVWALSILNKEYSGLQSVKKYGICRRYKMKKRDKLEYQRRLLRGFIFQAYVDVTVDKDELTKMCDFCLRNKLYILADNIKTAINVLDSSEDLRELFINRAIGIGLYVKFLLSYNKINISKILVVESTGTLIIKTSDINSLFSAK